MKVLVFPALLAIAIITGPAKSGTGTAAPTAPNKPTSTATLASLEPAKSAQPAPANTAPHLKAPLGQHPASGQ
ncbi:hypothetical protein [Hymenobacter lapidiphilus]|uniref:hypothetical protein n=1 Tax=Hymenobacter sp. CCM 8763 TaxID=2303334 RepID=UPI0011C188CF|nr:hypothetical protein [Hymenobacter sp. CCM 8763]